MKKNIAQPPKAKLLIDSDKKICKDCKFAGHWKYEDGETEPCCMVVQKADLVYGTYSSINAYDARNSEEYCGIAARFFEANNRSIDKAKINDKTTAGFKYE